MEIVQLIKINLSFYTKANREQKYIEYMCLYILKTVLFV